MTPEQILKEYLQADLMEKSAKAIKENCIKEAEKLRAISGKKSLDLSDDFEVLKVDVEGSEYTVVRKATSYTIIKKKRKLTPEESLVQSVEKGKYQ